MSVRTVTKVIVSCDTCRNDLLDADTESPALFTTAYSAVGVVHDLAGECWGQWRMEHDGRATCPDCRPKCPECGEYIDTTGGQCDDPWQQHDDEAVSNR